MKIQTNSAKKAVTAGARIRKSVFEDLDFGAESGEPSKPVLGAAASAKPWAASVRTETG
jgi:hypothetical protein